jgi:hypothetical protein
LVQNVEFSAVVFKIGDKLSSVLILPIGNLYNLERHSKRVLGGSLSVDAVSKIKSGLQLGVRYRNNSLLVNSQDTQTNFTPAFVDVQTKLSGFAKVGMEFLGIYHKINTNTKPTRETKFGT